MRQAEIYRKGILAGILTEDDGDYRFCYDESYLTRQDAHPISLTLPLQAEAFTSPVLFPFFDGLIPQALMRLSQNGKHSYMLLFSIKK